MIGGIQHHKAIVEVLLINHTERTAALNKISVIAVDLAKNVIQFHSVDGDGTVVLRKQLTHSQMFPFLAK